MGSLNHQFDSESGSKIIFIITGNDPLFPQIIGQKIIFLIKIDQNSMFSFQKWINILALNYQLDFDSGSKLVKNRSKKKVKKQVKKVCILVFNDSNFVQKDETYFLQSGLFNIHSLDLSKLVKKTRITIRSESK